MRRRFGKWLVVLSLVVAVGGHWAILQSLAWVGMFVDFAQTAPLAVALEKTFDGQHPCKLCKAVRESQDHKNTIPMQKVESKIDFWMVLDRADSIPIQPFSFVPSDIAPAEARLEPPPTPPPKAA